MVFLCSNCVANLRNLLPLFQAVVPSLVLCRPLHAPPDQSSWPAMCFYIEHLITVLSWYATWRHWGLWTGPMPNMKFIRGIGYESFMNFALICRKSKNLLHWQETFSIFYFDVASSFMLALGYFNALTPLSVFPFSAPLVPPSPFITRCNLAMQRQYKEWPAWELRPIKDAAKSEHAGVKETRRQVTGQPQVLQSECLLMGEICNDNIGLWGNSAQALSEGCQELKLLLGTELTGSSWHSSRR